MRDFSASPYEMAVTPWRTRALIVALVKREVIGRYRGSVLGLLWSFLNPLLMLTVYTFVFSVVFKARWSGGVGSKTEFALVLFAGLLVFNIFSECVSRAPGLILSNANYVKKVVFPLEILPWVSLGSAIFHAVISFAVWLLFYAVFFGVPHWTVILFPVVLLPVLLMIMGFSWALASLGVYLRDVGQIITLVISITMFLSPIFYPLSALPLEVQPLLKLNPLTIGIEQAREVLVWGHLPGVKSYCGFLVASIFTAWLGFAWFQKTRKGFADVL
jgi:lipopolysaccharide transport system permease protein